MHIPDGLLNSAVIGTTGTLTVLGTAKTIQKTKALLDDSSIPTAGIMAAFIFAAQMLQFPAGPGVSGHLLGGALSAILFGPWIGSFIMSIVLIIQCIVFQDGGLLALGANILNMAFIGVFSAYFIYEIGHKLKVSLRIFAASFFSVLLTASFAGLELGLSGVFSSFSAGFFTIFIIHIPIAAIESVITLVVVSFISSNCPEYFKLLRRQPSC
ncbi:energy-coupling factor ABC transporter permease [candidate division KSB1 bacterium]